MIRKNFDHDDILKQVLAFMAKLGIEPYSESDIILTGELHRFRTREDKASEKSGAIKIYTDGWPAGYVQDWRKGIKEYWRYDTSNFDEEQQKYFNSEEYRKKMEERERKAREKRRMKQIVASEAAARLWERLEFAPTQHPYIVRKRIPCFTEDCLRYNPETKSLAVPLKDIEGRFWSIQWIPEEGDKRFFIGTSTDGIFWSVWLDVLDKNPKEVILLGEGFATMAKVFELMKKPCVAAMSCYKLEVIAKKLREKYPEAKIIITADNDHETECKHERNPGLLYANIVANSKMFGMKLADGVVFPPFTEADAGLSDWDDYAMKYGDEAAQKLLQEKIADICMTDEERAELERRKQLVLVIHDLNPSQKIEPQEFVGGIFPRKFVSMLIAPPGTGKTIFVQKFVSDVSMGGNVFDGFAEDEPERKCLILAGEAGYELLLMRGASMRWAINPKNVKVLDQYEAENQDINIMLDSPEGMKNVERLIEIYKPDILFIDTLSSFHESDENKAPEMKPIIKHLAALARQYNMAVVPVHHSRKRAAKERTMPLDQNDVVGSSVMNRLVGLIIGIEPMKDNETVLLVRALKSWFTSFTPFTYTLKDKMYGGTVVQTDLAPSEIITSKASVWFYLQTTFAKGEWFAASQIILSEISGKTVTTSQLRRILAEFVKEGKLERRGVKKSLEYSISA